MTLIRTLLTICVVVFVSSCDKNENVDSRSFFLQDSLFRIDVIVPTELDSFHTWIDYDDTSRGHLRKYRFSDSKYPVFEESGFFYPTYPDSSYRLTFSHIDKYDCQDLEDGMSLNEIVSRLEESAKKYRFDFKLFSSDNIDVNGLTFDILKFKTDLLPEQKYQSTLVWGFAKIDGIHLKVEYECASKNCDSFIERMSESLESMRVTKEN